MVDLKDLAQNGAQSSDPADTPVEAEEQKFQHYSSSRSSMRMMTSAGKKISFIGYKLITADQEVIDYLDAEIKAGLGLVTKGELLTSKEADPMEALRRKHIEEYKKEQAQLVADAAAGKLRDMGSTKTPEAIAAGAKPMSTSAVASGPSGS